MVSTGMDDRDGRIEFKWNILKQQSRVISSTPHDALGSA